MEGQFRPERRQNQRGMCIYLCLSLSLSLSFTVDFVVGEEELGVNWKCCMVCAGGSGWGLLRCRGQREIRAADGVHRDDDVMEHP